MDELFIGVLGIGEDEYTYVRWSSVIAVVPRMVVERPHADPVLAGSRLLLSTGAMLEVVETPDQIAGRVVSASAGPPEGKK